MRNLSDIRVVWLLGVLVTGMARAEVVVEEAYVRATPPGQRMTGAFMRIHNPGEANALVAARSPVAKVVELHTHVKEGGMMRMRPLPRIALPPREWVQLQPGGLHVMLIGLKQAIQPGQRIELELQFANGEQRVIHPQARQMRAMGSMAAPE